MTLRTNNTPTYAAASTFLGTDIINCRDAEVCIAGIPYDLAVSNRPGARFGPAAIRAASRMLIDGDHPFHRVNPNNLGFSDVGNFDLVHGDILGSLDLIEEQAAYLRHVVALGGDHSISLPLLRAVHKKHGPVGLIHLDAHIDTWPDNFGGQPYGHGNPFYHAINEGLVDPKRMIQIGIRSPVQNSVIDWTVNQGVTIYPAAEFTTFPFLNPVFTAIRRVVGSDPCYLTVDIDVLDPAFAPGTGTPEIGGLSSGQLQQILRGLTDVSFIGMDVVEVCPAYDVSEITALAAATVVWEYLSILTVQNEH